MVAGMEQMTPPPLFMLVWLRPCGQAHCTYRALMTLMSMAILQGRMIMAWNSKVPCCPVNTLLLSVRQRTGEQIQPPMPTGKKNQFKKKLSMMRFE